MPFPFKKAGNAQQLAAQLAWDYENSESAENELDAFIDDVAAELLTMAGEGAEVNEEEQARLQRLTEAAGELRRASKEAAQQMLLGEFEAAKESLAQAEEAAARMETDLQTLREAQGPEGFAANFINNWDANDHPSKKYMALAGSYTPERMPGNMTEKEKWRWVQEQNIGEDTPYYKHEDKVNAIATALAAYKFGNDRPTPAFSERRLRSAANALKKDPVFKFLAKHRLAHLSEQRPGKDMKKSELFRKALFASCAPVSSDPTYGHKEKEQCCVDRAAAAETAPCKACTLQGAA